MRYLRNILILLGLCVFALNTRAQNSDILWQKTLTADTLPIRSIAIAEGKYVAALKGNQIVILDYVSGDSIQSFTAPKDMYGANMVLGKGGERLYVFFTKPDYYYPTAWIRVWDISSGKQLTDFELKASYPNSPYTAYSLLSYTIALSRNGKYIAFQYTYKEIHSGSGESTHTNTSVYNTLDTIIGGTANQKDFSTTNTPIKNEHILSGYSNVSFSQSENYILTNTSVDGFISHPGTGGLRDYYSRQYGSISSLNPKLKSYEYPYNIPSYKFSSDDDFLLLGNQLYDLPPTRSMYSFSKVGFVFLPDDNHMLAFKAGGGVAAISNIEQDSWEKVYQGDSLTENIIQTNASRTAFATAAGKRITLWKIPSGLQSATLSANYSLSKDTISIGDTIQFSNKTYPFKRGNNYTWNFGDTSSNSNELHPNHRFTYPGTFTVTLEVHDTIGRSSTITKQVVVKGFKIPSGAVWTNKASNVGINCIAYSPDGGMIVSGGNSSVRIWDSYTAKLQKSISLQTSVYSVRYIDFGKSIAIGSTYYRKSQHDQKQYLDTYNDYMHLWRSKTDSLTQIISWENLFLRPDNSYLVVKFGSVSTDFSSDNKYYLAGYRTIVDVSPTRPDISKDFASTLQSNLHYGSYLFYNFETKKARTHDIYSYNDSNHLRGYYALKISPDNKYYATIQERKLYGDPSPTLFLKDILTDSILRQIHTTATTMRFSPDKYHLLTSTALWDVYDSVMVQAVTLPQVFEYHPDGIHVFTIRPDSTIGIYNLHSNSYEYIYPKQPTTFTCLAVAPDGKHFATGDINGFITVWKVPDSLKTTVKADFTTFMTKRSGVKTTDTVDFFNTSLPASDNTLYYFWDFGDGTTSSEVSPKHRFTIPGKYTVTLTVFQYGKIMDTIVKAQYITVTAPIAAEEVQTGIYENSVSIHPNPSYGEARIRLTFAQAGEYSVQINDNLGREIARWAGMHAAGEENIIWNSDVPSGVYFGVLSAGGVVKTVPIVVVR